MKIKRIIALGDIQAQNPQFRALNPHLYGPAPRPGPSPRPFSPLTGLPVFPEDKKGKVRGQMNATEREFSLILDAQKEKGEITGWGYESLLLRWGCLDALRYSPDFLVWTAIEGLKVSAFYWKLIEVKGGFIYPKDLLRFKSARNHWHGIFHFEMHQKTKENGWRQIL